MKDTLTKEKVFALNEYEMRCAAQIPQALRAIADWHSIKETEADAFDFTGPAKYHRERRLALCAEADRLDKEYSS